MRRGWGIPNFRRLGAVLEVLKKGKGESVMIFGISKTTINGILAAIIGAAGPLTAYLATVNNPKAATAAGIVTLIATICRVWVGIIQNDAPPAAAPAQPAQPPTTLTK
jgi:Zn-dependent alcohol dehydrogenase